MQGAERRDKSAVKPSSRQSTDEREDIRYSASGGIALKEGENMNTFENYKEKIDALGMDEFEQIHRKIVAAVGHDETALELYRDVLDASWEYMHFRFEWGRKDLQGRAAMDGRRTDAHNAVIRRFVILGRQCKKLGTDVSWLSDLGDCERDPIKRKRYGDFAMYLCFVETIHQR